MGSALYNRQQSLLEEHFRRIVLMLDGDPAGRRASLAIANRLARSCSVRTVDLAVDRQPDQFSEQAIREILTQEGGKPENY